MGDVMPMDEVVIRGEGTVTPVDVDALASRLAKAALDKESVVLSPGEVRVIVNLISSKGDEQ